MRILGLDYGSKRIGVAVSDEMEMIAQPLEFIPAAPTAAFYTRLRAIVDEKSAGLLVVGMPRNMDGSYGPAAERVREFIASLEKEIRVPVRTWDERLTSSQANRALIEANVRRERRKTTVDKMAAALLLQSFLDARAA